MSEIAIGQYVIRHDGTCSTLYKVATVTGENARGKKPKAESIGQQREVSIGFFANPKQALERLLREELGDPDVKTVSNLIAKIDSLMAALGNTPLAKLVVTDEGGTRD